jgi:hypothetical protein
MAGFSDFMKSPKLAFLALFVGGLISILSAFPLIMVSSNTIDPANIVCIVVGLIFVASAIIQTFYKQFRTMTFWALLLAVSLVVPTFVFYLLLVPGLIANAVGFLYAVGATISIAGSIYGLAYTVKSQTLAASLRLLSKIIIVGLVVLTIFLYSVSWLNDNYGLGQPGTELGASCIGQPGISCISPIITQNGSLSAKLGYDTGYTAYNPKLSCISVSNSVSPKNLAYQDFISNGNLSSGETISVTNLQCYPTTGSTHGMLSPIGSEYVGTIWMEYYTSSANTASPQFIKVATFSVKSTS